MSTGEAVRTGAFNAARERFAVFLRNTDQKEVQLDATLSGIQRMAPAAWSKLRNSEQLFRIYVMGAGNGGLELPLLKSFIAERGTKDNISISCEDVSQTMASEFNTNAITAGLSDIVSDYQVIPFEDPSHDPPLSDFSMSSHVWYYIQDWRNTPKETNTLQKFANSLDTNGVGLITIYSSTSDRYELLAELHKHTAQPAPELPGEEIVAELAKLNIENQSEIVNAHTDVSSCFQDGAFSPNRDGKLLLSFILRTDWERLPEAAQRGIGERLAEIVRRNGRAEMVFRDLYIWLHS
ncbi:MAG: hypothetical protein HYS26_04070 [Candidatus Kaiserbacteria bacterium]|nr:MAG: hypothetical protein HYS26_04070 [Candidatus Kaiserbacteria bacterium]